ncbi:MAG: PRC-barrel domain-containing protein [Pseudomonadota bacterium]
MRNFLMTTTAAALALSGSVIASDYAADKNERAATDAEMQSTQKWGSKSTKKDKIAFSDDEINAIAVLTQVTSRPTIELGDDAIILTRSAHTAKRLIDRPVYNMNDEKIATVEDIRLNDDGRIDTLILASGGFAGLNERTYEAPFSEFRVEMTDDDFHRLSLDKSKEEFRSFAKFDRNAVTDGWFVNELIGLDATFANPSANKNYDSAYLDDVIFTFDGEAQFASVEYGGLLGIGEKTVLVPFERVSIAQGDGEAYVDIAERDVLTGVTFFYDLKDVDRENATTAEEAQ